MKNRTAPQHNIKHSVFFSYKLTAVLVIVNFLVVGALLSFMTRTDTQSTNITKYTQSISDYNIQNQILQQKIAEAQSIDNITQKAQELGMVQANNIIYLNNTDAYSYNIH